MIGATKPTVNIESKPKRAELRVLVQQGGGALGAYQAGVYERLAAAKLEPDWVVGISIGAINGALIAGNPPQRRAERLREFWERVSVPGWGWLPGQDWSAHYAMAFGVPGFFSPRLTPAPLAAPGSDAALSYYDPAPLRSTLEELVDFDRLNQGGVRLSVGAVEVVSGDERWFDTAHERITVDHILASGALPPGFPPVMIDGVAYWDGGIVSNTPLQYVIDHPPARDLLVFQVDLFSARGADAAHAVRCDAAPEGHPLFEPSFTALAARRAPAPSRRAADRGTSAGAAPQPGGAGPDRRGAGPARDARAAGPPGCRAGGCGDGHGLRAGDAVGTLAGRSRRHGQAPRQRCVAPPPAVGRRPAGDRDGGRKRGAAMKCGKRTGCEAP
jgi:predicted acylesterase/phospholipase RssA